VASSPGPDRYVLPFVYVLQGPFLLSNDPSRYAPDFFFFFSSVHTAHSFRRHPLCKRRFAPLPPPPKKTIKKQNTNKRTVRNLVYLKDKRYGATGRFSSGWLQEEPPPPPPPQGRRENQSKIKSPPLCLCLLPGKELQEADQVEEDEAV
jgi:hypothetical protein